VLAQDKEAWDATALVASYNWTGLAPVDDTAFDDVRAWFDILGLTEEEVLDN
jgi:hypothetical protein